MSCKVNVTDNIRYLLRKLQRQTVNLMQSQTFILLTLFPILRHGLNLMIWVFIAINTHIYANTMRMLSLQWLSSFSANRRIETYYNAGIKSTLHTFLSSQCVMVFSVGDCIQELFCVRFTLNPIKKITVHYDIVQ